METAADVSVRDLGAGVHGAGNAWTVSDDATRAFFWDAASCEVVEISLPGGGRKTLEWHDEGFAKSNEDLLCYCLFHVYAGSTTNENLVALFFNRPKGRFKFTVFEFSHNHVRSRLAELRGFEVAVERIDYSKLAYTAHKTRDNCIQVIFYERLDPSSTMLDGSLAANVLLCQLDINWMRLYKEEYTKLPGVSSGSGCWQMPFITSNRIHFLKIENNSTFMASLPLWCLSAGKSVDKGDAGWLIRRLNPHVVTAPPASGQYYMAQVVQPERKAIWCNSWCSDGEVHFALVTKLRDRLVMYVWRLDIGELQWQRVESTRLELPLNSSRFSIRLCDYQSHSLTAYFHYDLNCGKARLIGFHGVSHLHRLHPVVHTLLSSTAPGSVVFALPDVICPICLETYSDPRTLQCGHSLCYSCLVKMREIGSGWLTSSHQVKCPNCRLTTKVPSAGLPTNYALRDAIEMMLKQQADFVTPFPSTIHPASGGCKPHVERSMFDAMALLKSRSDAMKRDFAAQVDHRCIELRCELISQTDSHLIKGLREFWLSKYDVLTAQLLGALYSPSVTVVDIEHCEQHLQREMVLLEGELDKSTDAIRHKAKTLMELFTQRLIGEDVG